MALHPDANQRVVVKGVQGSRSFKHVAVGSNAYCAVATLGPCVLLLWRSRIVHEGVTWTQNAFADLLRVQPGEQVSFLTVLEAGCDLTTAPNVRRGLADLLSNRQKEIAAAAIVFEGEGFRMTMVRSVITAIYLASRARFPNSVFSTVHPAALWLENRHLVGADAVQLGRAVALMRKRERDFG